MSKILPIVKAFQSYLTDERHFSPYTAKCYGADLRQFVEFLCEEASTTIDMDIEQDSFDKRDAMSQQPGACAASMPTSLTKMICGADVDLIRSFLSHLADQNYSSATMARKIATLRSFYKWGERRGLADSNPMTLIRTPRQSKRLPKAISLDQVIAKHFGGQTRFSSLVFSNDGGVGIPTRSNTHPSGPSVHIDRVKSRVPYHPASIAVAGFPCVGKTL